MSYESDWKGVGKGRIANIYSEYSRVEFFFFLLSHSYRLNRIRRTEKWTLRLVVDP